MTRTIRVQHRQTRSGIELHAVQPSTLLTSGEQLSRENWICSPVGDTDHGHNKVTGDHTMSYTDDQHSVRLLHYPLLSITLTPIRANKARDHRNSGSVVAPRPVFHLSLCTRRTLHAPAYSGGEGGSRGWGWEKGLSSAAGPADSRRRRRKTVTRSDSLHLAPFFSRL